MEILNSHFDVDQSGKGSREAFKSFLSCMRGCCTERAMDAQEKLMTYDGDYPMALFLFSVISSAEQALAEMDREDVNKAKESVQSALDFSRVEEIARSLGIDLS